MLANVELSRTSSILDGNNEEGMRQNAYLKISKELLATSTQLCIKKETAGHNAFHFHYRLPFIPAAWLQVKSCLT
jgi:hypothetical protein